MNHAHSSTASYFFNSLLDTTGTELDDIYTAQAEAIRTAGALLSEMEARFWNGTEWKMVVTNEERQVLFVLRFSAEEGTNLSSIKFPSDPPQT